MRFLKLALTALSFSFFALANGAYAGGSGYDTLPVRQSTDAGKKVEVLEFFSYACPHCNGFDPVLEAWVKKQGDNIVFKRVAVSFRPDWLPLQKMYYTLEAMGETDELHHKVFNAIHLERQAFNTDDNMIAIAVKNGIDKKKFIDTYNSFGVQGKLNRAKQLQSAYKVDQVPIVAIDGRYITSPSHASATVAGGVRADEPVLQAAAIKVLDELMAKVKK
jgi:thiol:disulfide interchange protein DsbA